MSNKQTKEVETTGVNKPLGEGMMRRIAELLLGRSGKIDADVYNAEKGAPEDEDEMDTERN